MNKRAQVTQHLWATVLSFLSEKGFRRVSGVHSYRDHDKTIDVLTLDFFDGASHRVWGSTTHSFGVSCGIFLKFAPNPFGGRIPVVPAGNLQPGSTVCAIRSNLWRTLRQPKAIPKRIWSVEADLSNVGLVANDVLTAAHTALPWFERFDSTARILALLRDGKEDMDGAVPCFGFGRKGSPVRNLYLGFTALEEGRWQLARDALNEAMSNGGFSQLSGSADVDNRIQSVISGL